jgi:penicillin G amidase
MRVLRCSVVLLALLLTACGEDDSASQFAAATPTPDPITHVPVNDTIHLPGLAATTDVVLDELGMPHVYAPDVLSAVFVQGYLTAESRFWEMDAFRRVAEGRLSELFGRLSLSFDVGMRTAFTTRDGRRLEEALWQHVQESDPDLVAIAQAYSDGVNAWLADLRADRNGATLPPEYTLGVVLFEKAEDLDPWRPQDTIAIARLQAWNLSETLEDEVSFARIMQSLSEDIVRDVFRSAPAAPTTVLPVTPAASLANVADALLTRPPALPPARDLGDMVDALDAMRRNMPLGSRQQGVGSNNWIVSPALSANGHAMLANDPHLQLFNPPIWQMIQLDGGEIDGKRMHVNGVIFPGIPGIILGNNDFGAWGGTVANFDVTDVYMETVTTPPDYPASPRTVLFKGQQVPVLRIEETFKLKKGQTPVTEVIEVVPHHGPMVPDPNLNDQVVGIAATNMSFRWTGHELTNDARFLVDLNVARNVNEFRAALRNFGAGGQNWVWADVNGDIAYFPKVLIPQRPKGTVPYLPMPGTGEAEWLTDAQGHTLWLPDDEIPQATNPPQGFLNTSNNDQIGNTLDNDPLNDHVYLAYTDDLGFRAQRVRELLSNSANVRPAGAKMTMADMSAYQYDHSSKEAARLLPFLFAAATARPDLVTAEMADALDRLRAWGETKPDAPPYDTASGVDAHDLRDDVAPRSTPVSAAERADAVATSIFAAWETRLAPAVFDDDFHGTGIGSPTDENATKALLHILEDIDRSDAGFKVYTKGANGESTLWDNKNTPQVETRDEILLGALSAGLAFLHSKFPASEPDGWLWGVMHQVRFQHFFAQANIGIFDLGPFAAPGARYTVNPANYDLNIRDTFTFSDGPSERYVVVLDPAGIHAVNVLPGGNNGNPGGTGALNYNRINPDLHYGDLIPKWINGQTFEYHISRADVAAHAVRKIRYVP